MAGDFVMVQCATPRKPEVLRISLILGIPRSHAFGLCVEAWIWFDEQTEDGHASGVTGLQLDHVVGHAGFAKALQQVEWLRIKIGGICVPNFSAHMGASAKKRAKDSKRQQLHREKLSQKGRDKSVTKEEGRREGKNIPSGDRKTIGSADAERGDTRSTVRRRSSRSPKDVSVGEQEHPQPFDLSVVGWPHVIAMAEAAARKVPPITSEDRRAWLRFGVLADVRFGEEWIADAATAVVNAAETRRTPQAHFVSVLKGKANEQHGVCDTEFTAMVRRIEIPTDVWKSSALEIPK